MDSGLAALLGATIGALVTLVTGTFAPLIHEGVRRRAHASESSRLELKRILQNLLTVFTERGQNRVLGLADIPPFDPRQTLALYELGMALEKKDRALYYIALEVSAAVNTGSDEQRAIAGFAYVATEWYVGSLSSKDIRAAYDQGISESLALDLYGPSAESSTPPH